MGVRDNKGRRTGDTWGTVVHRQWDWWS